LAWVHKTAFGREVVPDVNCTLQGANGLGARRFCVNRIEMLGRLHWLCGRLAVVVARHRNPLQRLATARHQFGKFGLGDACHRAAVLRVITQFIGHGARIGRHRDRAHPGAGVPGQQGLGAVVQVDQDTVAGLDTALLQARSDAGDVGMELAVGPDLIRAVERRPDQERVIAPAAGALLDQPGHVHAAKGVQ
jgi:hypothetical protein